MGALSELDRSLFFWVNQKTANPFFDALMPVITDLKLFLPLLIALCIALGWFGKRKGIVVVVCIVLAVALSDGISSHLIKPFVERLRPCVALEGVRMLIGKKTSFSFPSSHAANITAAAFVLSFFYRKALALAIIAAVLVSYSRIYVGVHYPLDVVSGFAVGLAMAALVVVAREEAAAWFERRKAVGISNGDSKRGGES